MNETLFGPIHQGHFRLFVSGNGPFYADLVEYLETRVFSLSAGTLKKRQVQAAISEFMSARLWQSSLEDDDLSDPKAPHQMVYDRLVASGWLLEHRDGFRTIVDIDGEARLFLQALLDIKSGRVRSFGGEVLQVKTLIDSAVRDPEVFALNVRSAGAHARRFMNSLRAITGALRKIEQEMRGKSTVADIMDSYFTSYVSDALVADYKKLRSRNNPYRFRQELIEQVDALSVDEMRLGVLSETFEREGHAATAEDARRSLLEDLAVIADVFHAVDEHLDLIEATNSRIEKRIRNIARFLDRMGDDRTGIFMNAARALGQTAMPSEQILPIRLDLLDTPPPVDSASLFRARAKPRATPPVVARKKQKDPALVLFQQEKRAYGERARVTPDKIRAFLDAQLGERGTMRGSEMAIETLDDFFVFERLTAIGTQFAGRIPDYVVLPRTPEMIDTEWITCADFEIRRTGERSDHAAPR
jgi:hypothetical protein